MTISRYLSGISIACLLAATSYAAEPLSPRVEVGVKGGTDRSLLTTEFWAPLAQKSDRVLYGDIRLMGDNDENREGNLGLGYRQIVDDAVLGVHGWIDRRRTQNNSTFHQVTLGVERLGHVVDARANMYVPLNQSRNINTPNIGQASPYLAGNGIFFDTNGVLQETPQYGVDGEVGYRIPVFQKHADAIRVYGGGYHFFRDETQDVTGFRVRTEAQINSAFSVGARFQHDGPRGSQGFLEAIIKFPFGAKKLYQTDYLRARLDESPERDVDIVTAARQIDSGLRKEILNNNTGVQQRVIHVDNSNAQTGDGSKENPFNTLKAAEAALQDNDILYVNHGTGTTTGMDQGLIINKAHVQLIGSGSNFVYDAGRFSSNSGTAPASGTLIAAAGLAPIITNIQTSTDDFTGNGIYAIGGGDLTISGLGISQAQGHGIYVRSENNTFGTISINNNTVQNNGLLRSGGKGIFVQSHSNGSIAIAAVDDNIVSGQTGSGGRGIEVSTFNGEIAQAFIRNNNSTNNASNGISLTSSGTTPGHVREALIANNDSSSNSSTGIYIQATSNGSMIENLTVQDNRTVDNNSSGIYVFANATGQINNAVLANNESSLNRGSNGHGVRIEANNNSAINTIRLSNHTLLGNSQNGVFLTAQTNSTIDQVNADNIQANGNNGNGFFAQSQTNSTISKVNLSDTTLNDNVLNGVYLLGNGGTISTVALADITANSNDTSGIHMRAAGTNGTINGVTITNMTANENVVRGLALSAAIDSNTVTNIVVSNSNFTNNLTSGVYVLNGTANSVITLDLGGGSAGSIGQNRIFGNTTEDLYIDRSTVSATNNWWNNGGAAPTRVTLVNGGSATYTPALSTDPRP